MVAGSDSESEQDDFCRSRRDSVALSALHSHLVHSSHRALRETPMPLEPQHVIGISMTALLALGGLAQFMQSRGGKLQKYAPVIVLTLLLLLSIGSIAVLSNMLSTSLGELVEAPSSFEAPEPIAANSDEALGG